MTSKYWNPKTDTETMCHYKKTKRWKSTYSSRLSQYITAGFDSLKKHKHKTPLSSHQSSVFNISCKCVYMQNTEVTLYVVQSCEQG